MKEIIAIIVFLGVIVGGAVYLPDLFRKQEESNDTRPSIVNLKNSSLTPSVSEALASPEGEFAQPGGESQDRESKPTDPAKLTIKVLNGGAPGGSAGKAASTLKTAGFKLVVAADAKGNYTGVTVFYQSSNKADAEAVKQALAKTYPAAQIKSAADLKTEEGSASIVVILGK